MELLLLLLHLVVLIELHSILLIVAELWIRLLLLVCTLDSSLPIQAIRRLCKHVIWLVHADLALEQLDERVQLHLVLSEGDALLEANAERLPVFIVLDGADLNVYEAADDVAFPNIILRLHVLERAASVLYHAAGEGLAVEEIQHPIVFLLVLDD